MLVFFKVLLHLLYVAVSIAIEMLIWQWLVPLIGVGLTIAVVAVTGIILLVLYGVIFWNWRPSWSGVGEFFDDIGDFDGGGSFFD